jgi:hypothetical protein
MSMWDPGFALSPDGRTLAIAAPNGDTLITVDTASLRLVSTHTLQSAQTPLQRLGIWLGLSPSTALAKNIEGTFLNLKFSPDGKLLFLTGMQSETGADGRPVWHGLGMRVVDAGTGRIMGSTLAGDGTDWVGIAPDGSSLYTLSRHSVSPEEAGCPCVLRRHDPATLQVTAERTFTSYPSIALLNRTQ